MLDQFLTRSEEGFIKLVRKAQVEQLALTFRHSDAVRTGQAALFSLIAFRCDQAATFQPGQTPSLGFGLRAIHTHQPATQSLDIAAMPESCHFLCKSLGPE